MIKIKKQYLLYLLILTILILSTLIISHYNWDLELQQQFYDKDSDQVWFQKNYTAWYWAYHYGTIPAIIISVAALLIFIFSWAIPKLKKFRKYCLLIILTLFFGPGLIINGILKDHWGRPRPRQVQEFGGKWEFKEVWQHGIPGKGKSFPCGHGSMGFMFIVLYYSYKKKNQILAYTNLGFSFTYGSFIGMARIAQGGHFLSDVIWAGGLTYLIASILYYEILKIPDYESEKPSKISENEKGSDFKKIIIVSGLAILSVALLIFVFLFSKPVYKEYNHRIIQDQSFNVLKFDFNTKKGDITIYAGDFEIPIQIKTIIQGFGYPKRKFRSKPTKVEDGDTLSVSYKLEISGYFTELDVEISAFIDTSTFVILSGENSEGDIFLDKKLFETKFINSGIKTPKGQILNKVK